MICFQMNVSDFPTTATVDTLQWQDFTEPGNKHCIAVSDIISPSEFYITLKMESLTLAISKMELHME